MDFATVCSGIDAPSLALEKHGWQAQWFSEIEAFPSAVLAHRWPHVKNLGDMTALPQKVLSGSVSAPSVLIGGTPCFTSGHSVLTAGGYVPIEKIKPGDQVVTHQGRLRRVVRVGSKDADIGLLSGVGLGDGITCTPEHPFRSVDWSNQNTKRDGRYARVERIGEPEWKAAKHMPGKQWCALLNSSVEPSSMPQGVEAAELLYIAGFYLGDGFIRRWPGKNKMAVIFGVNPEKLLRFQGRVTKRITVLSERTGPRIQLCSTDIARWLIDNFGEYSHSKTLPAWVLSHPNRSDLLKGYLDTDGHKQSNGWRSVSVSRALSYGVRDLAQTLGFVASVGFTKTADTTVIEGRIVNQRDYWTVTAFSRSTSRKSRVHHGMLLRTVSDFSLAGRDTVFNIEVEGDNSYILDGAIVHNCQAFSVAGMRDGLSDPRGALTIKFVELADAIDLIRSRRGEPESIVWWENVPGVLSDSENAFGCFLGALAGENCELQPPGGKWKNAGCVYGPKRAIAWRVLDAQYFGVAQRRRRVFVVASAREGFDPAAVLFEPEGLRRDTPPSREKGQGFTHDVAPSLVSSGRGVERTGETRGQDPVVAGFRMAAFGEYSADGSASTMKARDYKDATDLAVSVALRGREGGATAELGGPVAGTLRASSGGGDKPHVMTVHGTQDPCVSDNLAFALGRNNGGENAVCFAENSRSEIRLEGGDGQRTGALSTGGGKPGQGQPVVATNLSVRRLTPVECERLQGMPDNHTNIPPWYACACGYQYPEELGKYGCPNCCGEYTGRLKKIADGPRYKAIGNSMAVPVIEWIGKRIMEVLR